MKNTVFSLFLLGFCVYVFSVFVSYTQSITLATRVGLAIVIGALSQTLWQLVMNALSFSSDKYLAGFVWDAMILFTYAVVPVMMLGVTLSVKQMVGIAVTVSGLFIMR